MSNYDDPQSHLDECLFLLANYRRRVIIRYLHDTQKTSLREVAEVISEMDRCTSTAQMVYVNLYQSHAPKLTQADVVDYDSQEKTLSQGPQFKECYAILECADTLG
jgi:hypothetical protein